MMSLLSILNSIIFLVLSLIHIYWAFGGKWGIAAAIPTTLQGRMLFFPGAFASSIVAFGLLLFSIFTFVIFFPILPGTYHSFHQIVMYSIGVIFALRTVGDRNYVGLFRKMEGTSFGQKDKYLYTPLCLYLSLSSFFLAKFL